MLSILLHGEREARFNGKVAAALHAKADTIVKGGWDNGVLANVHHFDILAGM